MQKKRIRDTKRCKVCRKIKSISEFGKHKRSKDGYAHICRSCKANEREQFKINHPMRLKILAIMSSHRQRGHTVLITKEELEVLFTATHCPLCGCKFGIGSDAASLDRINNESELRSDNVWVICKKCNFTKSNRTLKEFHNYCEIVVENLKELNFERL